MLKGIDVSHHNYINIERSRNMIAEYDFVIAKATEGKTFVDKRMHDYFPIIKEAGKLLGFYHYARPENNSPEDEAENFLKAIEHYIKEGVIVCLDWEGTALAYSETWVLRWMEIVKQKTGAIPFLYIQHSALNKVPGVAAAGYPLWVARYNKEIGNVSPFHKAIMWQYTSTPLDKDIFYGSREEWYYYSSIELKEQNIDSTYDVAEECAKTVDEINKMMEETREEIINAQELLDNAVGRLFSYRKTLEKVSNILKGNK